MLSHFRKATNPLYYIVLISTGVWAVALVSIPIVNQASLVYEYYLVVFANWAVLPVAMAFDIGILRQRFGFSGLISLLCIVLSAVPVFALLGGLAYILFRARVVSTSK